MSISARSRGAAIRSPGAVVVRDVPPTRRWSVRKQAVIREPIERTLAIELVAFGGVVDGVAASLEFHWLAQYLHTLVSTFTSFYKTRPVLKADAEIRESRLALCDLTAPTLKTGLGLLGIESPDQM